jgi:hypothetical protein
VRRKHNRWPAPLLERAIACIHRLPFMADGWVNRHPANREIIMRAFGQIVIAGVAALALAACSEKAKDETTQAAETVAEDTAAAVDEAGAAVEGAAADTGAALEGAAADAAAATQEAKEDVGAAMEKAGDKLEKAGEELPK